MKMINEMQENASKQSLENSFDGISEQIQLIEQRYRAIIKDGVSKELQDHQKKMSEIKTMINIIKINYEI